jgi:Nucleotide-diphospho-sugar transferase
VPLDPLSYEVLLETYPDNLIPPMGESSSFGDHVTAQSFGTPGFKKLNRARPVILRRFAESGFTFFYNDADIVWKTNLMDVMEGAMNEGDKKVRAVFVEDQGAYCSCMIYMQPTQANIDLLGEWPLSYTEKEDDQIGWNRAIERKYDSLSFRMRNATHNMPNGKQYFGREGALHRTNALVVHNNYIVGKDKKLQRFKSHGLWHPTGRLERVEYSCDTNTVNTTTNRSLSKILAVPPGNPSTKTEWMTKSPTSGIKSTSTQNRTLVVLIGYLGGGEATWRSLYRNLLDPNDADLALMLDGEPEPTTVSLQQRARFVWTIPQYDTWDDAIDDFFGSSSLAHVDKTSWHRLVASPGGPFSGVKEGPKGDGLAINFARWFLMKQVKDLDLLNKYDRFVITRPDQYYMCILNLADLDETKIWAPAGEEGGGMGNRFVTCPKDHLMPMLNVLEPAIRQPEKYSSFQGNIETFTKHRWTEEGLFADVRRFRTNFFTAAVQGNEAKWDSGLLKPGFFRDGGIVYFLSEDEYYQAMTCDKFL